MANLLQKSCCSFLKFRINSTNLFKSKVSSHKPPCNSLFVKAFGCERFVHLERKSCNLLTQGAGYRHHSESVLCSGTSLKCVRRIHMTKIRFGIEEFFPPGLLETQQPLPEEVKSGRSWRAAELRQKSNEDLHKLWYVLLKERNMLLTVQEESKRQEVVMPSPERLHKIKKSMAMIKVVLDERKRVLEALQRNYREAQKNAVDLSMNNTEGGKNIVEENSKLEEQIGPVPVAT